MLCQLMRPYCPGYGLKKSFSCFIIRRRSSNGTCLVSALHALMTHACSRPMSTIKRNIAASAANAALHRTHYVLPCPSRLQSGVPCQIYYFWFAKLVNRFRRNSREVITTSNRLNDYIFGSKRERERDTRGNSNWRHLVLLQCQTGADA